MPPKLLTRPAGVKPQAKSKAQPKTQPKQKGKGKGKIKTGVEAPRRVQDIILNREQSFELIRIGVNAAVSQFVFCRQFFPSNCYKTRIYDASDPTLTYETFINGSNVPKNLNLNEAGDEIISFNSIVRGTGHRGAEKLMDWLEFGVADAVNDKCLAKCQLSVYRKEVVPEQLVEAFTISFTYDSTQTNPSIQVSSSISKDAGKFINLGHAQDGLRDLITEVMNACRNIRGQSAGRKVSMQLLYNDNERPKNEYRGFRAASITQILPNDLGLPMGVMNTGLNGLAIKHYIAPSIDSHHLMERNFDAVARNVKLAAPRATIIEDHSQSSLKQIQSTQSDGTQQSTIQWLNEIGRTRGSQDMDTQLVINNGKQPATSRYRRTRSEVGELGDREVEKASDDEVRCECSSSDDRENLIKCCNCGNYCHSQCYGYSKGTVGANFECYECLLAESEPSILFEKIYPLCTRRRMVYYLEKHGFRDTGGLCQYMNLNQDDTQNLIDTLRTEGIVKKCPGLSKEPFRFADLDKLHAELFDPSTHIGHTKLFAGPETHLPGKSRDHIQRTPVARRSHQPNDGSRGEGSSTQTPSSWRSLHNEDVVRRSPRISGQSTPHQPRKRAGEEIPPDSSKRRRSALAATSPFSLRSNSSH